MVTQAQFGDFGQTDHLAGALRFEDAQLLTPAQREQLRRYLWRALPEEDFHPGISDEARRERVQEAIEAALRSRVVQGFSAGGASARRLFDEVVGLGPIAQLLTDPTVTSVTVAEPQQVMVERLDRPGLSFSRGFASEGELMRVIENLAARAGRTISSREPILDLAWDNPPTRVHINLLSGKGPFVAWRRGRSEAVAMADYLADHRLNVEMAEFFRDVMRTDLGIAVTGVPGTGKTTMTEMLLHLTTPQSAGHVVVIEETPEMVVHDLDHVSVFRVPPVRPGEEHPIGLAGLTIAALRMNARRLVVGEVRGAEAGALVSIMPGFHGVMFTVHAVRPEAAVERLVSIAQMGGARPPSPYESGRQEHIVRRQIATGVSIVVTMARLPDGKIIVDRVDWLDGLEGDYDFRFTNVFQSRKTVSGDEITVTWERNEDFHLPSEVVASMAATEAGAKEDRAEFTHLMHRARVAAEAEDYAEALDLLRDALSQAGNRRGEVLGRIKSVAMRAPGVWEEAREQAQDTKAMLDEVLSIRAWQLAMNLIEALEANPVTLAAFQDLADWEHYRSRVLEGRQAMSAAASARRHVEVLLRDEKRWDALLVLEDLRQQELAPDFADWVETTRLRLMEELTELVEGDGEARRLATLILRSVQPDLAPELIAWAKDFASEADELTVLLRAVGPVDVGEGEEGPDRAPDDGAPDALYATGCTAFAASDWATAREALQGVVAQKGDGYRAAGRLLKAIPDEADGADDEQRVEEEGDAE